MYEDIPDNYKSPDSTDPEEGWRYTQNDKNAKRPPELLTRDHVARCINREVKAGRGSPHGGVFLDISWDQRKNSELSRAHQKENPSMYHQFMQLANLDITKEPMKSVGLRITAMGGIRVEASAGDQCPACSRQVSAQRVSTARIVSAAIPFPTCSSLQTRR